MGYMFDAWLKVQVLLPKVERWSKYRIRNPKLRKQTVLHHQYSVCLAIIPVLFKLKEFNLSLDTELLKDAFMLHDIPEGLLKLRYDVLSDEKENYHDLAEYVAFRKCFEEVDPLVYEHLERSFLLQFANKTQEEINFFPT